MPAPFFALMQHSNALPAVPPASADVAGVRALLRQGNHAAALAQAEALLKAHDSDRELLLYAAACQRLLGRVPEALATLAGLERLHPGFSRLYEERGHCFTALRQALQAIEAFRRAVSLNYALPASWGMLANLHAMSGNPREATEAADQVVTLRKQPPEIVTATGLFMDGDLDRAEPLVRSFLLQHGNQVEAMRLLARIGMARKVYDDAETLLKAVLALAPDYKAARSDYAEALLEMHKYQDARRELHRLLEEDPANRLHYLGLDATVSVGLGEHERAVSMYRTLLRGVPEDADLHLSIAHALKTMGQRDEAIESYRRAAGCRAGFGDAYWSLANLKTYRFTDQELEQLRAFEADPATGFTDRCHLAFALGKALEDRAEYAESFRYYQLGNALKHDKSNYEPGIVERNTQLQAEVFTPEFCAQRSGWGAPDPDPIFIVGLPRAGSTLLEQILASHSLVEGTQELADVPHIVAMLRGRDSDPHNPRYPAVLAELDAAQFRELGERYLAETRVQRTGKPFFIDKMPNNFRHLGLIHLMLPRAKIIDARREPMACCFSNFKQLFARGQEFTYGIEDIARYYRTYLELMRHWDHALPGRVLRVFHEDVVEDLEGSVRRVLDFCELEFEPACVDFHKTQRSIRTASSEQVRQPINRDGLLQWKNYEPWLGGLKDALGDALVRYRDA